VFSDEEPWTPFFSAKIYLEKLFESTLEDNIFDEILEILNQK